MNGPGLPLAEQVRFVTAAHEVGAAGFSAIGRRAVRAADPGDRVSLSEVARHLGAVVEALASRAPDAVGLRAMADDLRSDLVGSDEFRTLLVLLSEGSLRPVAIGLVTAMRAAIGDVLGAVGPVGDRAFDLALRSIDLTLASSLHAVAPRTAVTADEGRGPMAFDGVSVSRTVLAMLSGPRKDFRSPLSVPKSAATKHWT